MVGGEYVCDGSVNTKTHLDLRIFNISTEFPNLKMSTFTVVLFPVVIFILWKKVSYVDNINRKKFPDLRQIEENDLGPYLLRVCMCKSGWCR